MAFQAFMKIDESWEVWNIRINKFVKAFDTKSEAVDYCHQMNQK